MASPVQREPGSMPLEAMKGQNGHTVAGCPPGLEPLLNLDKVLINQKTELLQELAAVETNNQYEITDVSGQPLFRVAEDSTVLQRLCCGPKRGFNLRVFSAQGVEVMRVVREFKCCSGCCWCAGGDGHCSFEIRVEAPPGSPPVGFARQGQSKCRIILDILDDRRAEVLKVRGPCCACACFGGDVDFHVMDKTGLNSVAAITKTWGGGYSEGFCREFCTSADNFTVDFPADMDAKAKATLIGATLLIDFMAFERNQGKRHKH